MSEHLFDSPEELDIALADFITTTLSDGIAKRGQASLVVSGGSTPKGLFATLAKAELPWSDVTILLADERWVPIDHSDSNERMVRELLLQNHASTASFLSLVPNYPDQASNIIEVQRSLSALGTFDIVILGMGGDSHTASLFPCCDEIEEGLTTQDSVLMTHPKTAPHARVSLSRSRLADTRHGIVHIVGDDKHAVLQEALTKSTSEAPISAFASKEGGFETWCASR